VLEAVCDLSTETCVTASDIKVEKDLDMAEEENPLAVKAEQEVSNLCTTCEC
jgi:hypothetical protein